jgi:hypothetical protein
MDLLAEDIPSEVPPPRRAAGALYRIGRRAVASLLFFAAMVAGVLLHLGSAGMALLLAVAIATGIAFFWWP